MEVLKVAFASNDGTSFNDKHFGDSDYYHIYEINEVEAKFTKSIENSTKNIIEEIHADPNKAKGVSGILKKEGIQVVISAVFGPNIKRIKQQFVCIIVRRNTLAESIQLIKENYGLIKDEWKKGTNRTHLVL